CLKIWRNRYRSAYAEATRTALTNELKTNSTIDKGCSDGSGFTHNGDGITRSSAVKFLSRWYSDGPAFWQLNRTIAVQHNCARQSFCVPLCDNDCACSLRSTGRIRSFQGVCRTIHVEILIEL